MNVSEIGDIMRKRRASLGLLQEDLSEMSGVNIRTIQHLELGRGNPSIQTIQKIALILGMEIVVHVKQPANG